MPSTRGGNSSKRKRRQRRLVRRSFYRPCNVFDFSIKPDQTWSVKTVNIQAAKTHLSRLVEEAAAGEEIILAKAGKPLARLVPFKKSTVPRQPGAWKGKVKIAADFDASDDKILRLFGIEK
jgi:prevent-host-death family protein